MTFCRCKLTILDGIPEVAALPHGGMIDNLGPMDPTKRFSSRVENYIKYRPGYPAALIDLFARELGLTPSSIIADIGSGTGISAEMFLRYGNTVYAVEPNREMREAAERLLGPDQHFHSVEGSAEATTLADSSVDFIVVAQAFHWFERNRAREEFCRILKPRGRLVLIWNERRVQSAFEIDYEKMLKEYATDYLQVDHRNTTDETLHDFFAANTFKTKLFDYYQDLDHDSLKGRLLSSSYVPLEGANHESMMRRFDEIFQKHSVGGRNILSYDTRVFYGTLFRGSSR